MSFVQTAATSSQPLAALRERFVIPDGVTYFDGNSLGLMPRSVGPRVKEVVEQQWAQGLIRSWNDAHWRDLATRTGDKVARLIGAAPGQVVACDSTSVNLFKVLVSAVKLRPGRTRIVTDIDSFPTDLYIIDQVARTHGLIVDAVPAADIPQALDKDVAAVVLTHVDYRTARIHDMLAYTRACQAAGALMIWDLSHTAGAVPCELDACAVDFAVGCGYKYLNGGPGAPAYLYVAKRHIPQCEQPLAGWFGHRAPFDFELQYRPAAGIERFLCGTHPVIGLSVLHDALDAFDGVDMQTLRAKSRVLTRRFIEAAQQRLAAHGFVIASPLEDELRGSHVSLRHPAGYEIMQALQKRQIIGDFRLPDFMRFGFAALYNTVDEVEYLVSALEQIMIEGEWLVVSGEERKAFT
ncbi:MULTISPECIES: kynureninase [Pseudomonas]|uniref:kynureninase n=1 Tax=Pseudomonas TaxID=286 RepID=UPI000C880263|nr:MULTISPECIES: kynureninase [Pseudomonas]MBP5055289.1 kynureninase [Pseudomonas chlororaphis]MBP5141189.1 kynureninase [Pseudomonas chlororaphis]PMY43406.1 kynureninase [Pseudomonas sp. FW306-2-2C-D06C]PYC39227.1 kynureninase [Pseudomonas chlororaphis]QTT83548.1 kynureninase [Pseudomonas chlororaphis]